MSLLKKIYTKNISSDKLGRQIFGALLQWRIRPFLAFVFLLTPFSLGLAIMLSPEEDWLIPGLFLVGLNLIVWLIIKVCQTLTNAFGLRRNENGITSCQIIILATLGFWVIGFFLIFDIQNNSRIAAAIGVIGAILGWIFQDRVKGVATFINLRRHHLLSIGDWIVVPKMSVDGRVQNVTLTTVTLQNWDTTTSTIPISTLQSEHFMNLQNMSDGKTYGRKMLKSFILDTGRVHPITEKEVEYLKSEKHNIKDFLPEEEIYEGALNARLFRLYLYHWLMSNPNLSHRPRLIVRWTDSKESGLTLEVYAFVINTDLSTYEWQQSQIIEHIVTSMEWFGLKLYQSPSGDDVSNSTVHINNPEVFIKEEKK